MKRTVPLTLSEEEGLRDLGYAIQGARLRRNISQDELAYRAGVSRATIVRLERGDRGIAIAVLHKVLTAFGYEDMLPHLLDLDPIGDDQARGHGRKKAGGLRR